ncbi:MAG: hypothetical protein BWY59_00195 [Verrucomicrobia bacterium ADurb.Bin345]|nr:MAG: hypothetical protein BWY59_00195 [Verrucomicrobia bacterium ADurb.Bin345]
MLSLMKTRGFALLLLACTASAAAEIPELINYQGRLVDGTNLVQGPVTLKIGIYTNAAGGDELYADTQTVAVADGLYAMTIGASNTPNGALRTALAGSECYVQATVNGAPLLPRERLASVGYALHAPESLKESFFPARSDGGGVTELVGSHPAVRVMPGASTYFTFQMPEGMTAVSNLHLLGVPAIGSGEDVNLYSTYGGAGASAIMYSNHVGMIITPVPGNLTEINIISAFAVVSAGDACGLRVTHPPGTGADMRYLGIVLRYSTE